MRKRLAISWVWVAVPVWLLVAIGLSDLFASLHIVSAQVVSESIQAVNQSSAHR